MQVIHQVGLSTTEIAWLWATYINDSASLCMLKHFRQYNDKRDLTPLLDRAIELAEKHMLDIRAIFTKEKYPVPDGFSEQDVDLSAPALFFDLFPVSYIYGMSRIGLVTYGRAVSNVAREDVRMFFTHCLESTLDLYNISIQLMLEKGIYDRPPMIPYPDQTEYIVHKETLLSKWFEKQRPLNVIEISEMFFNIERNFFGVILLTGFIQVAEDEQIKRHLAKGKELAQRQIQFINETLIDEDLLGNIMVNSEVSASTKPPFSDKLIMYVVTTLNTQGGSYIGNALASSSRVDLIAAYTKYVQEIMQYGKDGADLMIARGWLEEPPHAPDRKALARL